MEHSPPTEPSVPEPRDPRDPRRRFELPGQDAVGQPERLWTLPTAGDTLAFRGRLLGIGSSHRPHPHQCDFARTGRYADRSDRCSACRWHEIRLFRVEDESPEWYSIRYVLHHTGRSIVPGEVDLHRHSAIINAADIIETFTVRQPGRPPFLSKPGLRVLAQAVALDPLLAEHDPGVTRSSSPAPVPHHVTLEFKSQANATEFAQLTRASGVVIAPDVAEDSDVDVEYDVSVVAVRAASPVSVTGTGG
jgi:hypothetical protein